MTKYLYGASVQGIQSFIFQTNKLTEIAGASELVEQICTTKFWEVAEIDKNDEKIIVNAAGNIKYIFTDRTACEVFVKKFPKTVMEMAPGITISQAVIAFENDVSKENTQELDKRLKTQRNKAIQVPSSNLMISEIARKTGGAGVKFIKNGDNKEAIDLAQLKKQELSDSANKTLLDKIAGNNQRLIAKFPFEIDDIASNDSNNWIAVVHADGNNLGQKIIKMVESLDAKVMQEAMKEFSDLLDKSTIDAAKIAFDEVIRFEGSLKFPFRPVVLGGDDLTAIIRGDLALKFTEIFLTEFESKTKENFKDFDGKYKFKEVLFGNGLTACAGISYIKASYPFHYGVKLSESLCKEAKKISKDINKEHTPSSIVFHKVHASFVEDYDDIIKKELTAKNDIQFNYGPYFLENQDGYMTIKDLQSCVEKINRKDSPKAGLRTWLTELQNNKDRADQLLLRVRSLYSKYDTDFNLSKPFTEREDKKKNIKKYTPIFDIISLANIQKK